MQKTGDTNACSFRFRVRSNKEWSEAFSRKNPVWYRSPMGLLRVIYLTSEILPFDFDQHENSDFESTTTLKRKLKRIIFFSRRRRRRSNVSNNKKSFATRWKKVDHNSTFYGLRGKKFQPKLDFSFSFCIIADPMKNRLNKRFDFD